MTGNCRPNKRDGERELFGQIQTVSFAMDDLRLFLDTHPDNAEALALYSQYGEQRHSLIAQYTKTYGPINSYYVVNDGSWSWVDEPMPCNGGI